MTEKNLVARQRLSKIIFGPFSNPSEDQRTAVLLNKFISLQD